MIGTAVAVVGVPGTITNALRKRLEREFPSGYVLRVTGAIVRRDNLASYDPGLLEQALDAATDAVFGNSQRPVGFCRNPNRPCQKNSGGRHTCGRSGNEACMLDKPRFLLVAYQDGESKNRLKELLYFAPIFFEIPKDLYGKPKQTADFVAQKVRSISKLLPLIQDTFSAGTPPPLLLPPRNFGSGDAVRKLIERVTAVQASPKLEVTDFRRVFFERKRGCFVGRGGLGFCGPAPHGTAAAYERRDIALSRNYRAGCAYPPDRHWDVQPPPPAKSLGGRWTIYCRLSGESRPRGRYVNLLTDDCVR